MSTYISHNKPLEYDNAPDWLVAYMMYRRTMLNSTQETVMTYFKDLRGFFQWASWYQSTGHNPSSSEALHQVDILSYSLEDALLLKRTDIETYLYFLAETLENGVATRNKKLASIKSFYDYILDHQEELGVELAGSPAGRIKIAKLPKTEPIYLPVADQESLLQGIQGRNEVRDKAIFLLLQVTGMRISELVMLDITDVNLEEGSVLIRYGKGNKQRTAVLTQPCCDAIRDYLEQYRSQIPMLETKALFVSKQEKSRFTSRSIERAMQKYTRNARLWGKGYTPHKLRHTTATTLAKEGKSPAIIKEILGHETISTTQRYMHLDNTDIANAIQTSSLNQLGAKKNGE